MPWQGQSDNLIDRFDARAHLDFIPPISTTKPLEDISTEERQCNYERYRILAQNDFLGMSEDKYLHQLHLEEQFGVSAQFESDKVKKKGTGAAIGYTYDDNEPAPFSQTIANAIQPPEKDDSDDSDLDVDVAIDISKLETTQAHELNGCGRHYGMKSNDFYSYLTKDADEADALRIAKEEEAEKIMLSGRKSRRERRAERFVMFFMVFLSLTELPQVFRQFFQSFNHFLAQMKMNRRNQLMKMFLSSFFI